METEIQNAVKTYKDLSLIPSPSSAVLRILPEKHLVHVYSTWSIQDLIRAESTKFTQEFLLRCDGVSEVLSKELPDDSRVKVFELLSKGIPSDISNVIQCAFTKSGNRFALLRKSVKKDEPGVFLEVWNLSSKECTFDLNECKEHGKVYDNGELQSLKWSSNEKFLLYIAEAKQKKSESFFKDVFCQKDDQKPSEDITKGEENLYRESWGESYVNVHHSVLCIFEVATGKVDVLNLDDKFPNTSVAQATWGPDDESVVFVGYREDPSRLGLVYCSNRRSSIFSYSLTSKSVERLINDENLCVEHPVFSPDCQTFVFLQHVAGGPHKSCRKLMKCEWKNKKISTVIDIVNEAANERDFAGVYTHKLSSRWWSSDSRFFFFHTFRRSHLEIFFVDILSSEPKVEKIPLICQDSSCGSFVLHDVKDPYILISVSSPNIEPYLMIGVFIDLNNRSKLVWSPVNFEFPKIPDLSWNVCSLTPSVINKVYPKLNYDIITVFSNVKQNGVLIIFPHGGPHSTFTTDFSLYVAAFARLGFIVCEVNYRGSLGFGENSVLSLPGNVGSQDVSDVVDAIEYLKEQKKEFQIKHVVGFGGSHGGFLIAHLIGQYPNLLKAAVIRNPVIDLGSMARTSDIPDWCWIESGCSKVYNPLENANPEYLKEMWEKSPIKYMKDVKTPTLLCLGKNDLRVPPSQGLLFYRYLRAQNVPSKVFYYDDNHALSKTAVTSDVFVQTILWFQSHLSL